MLSRVGVAVSGGFSLAARAANRIVFRGRCSAPSHLRGWMMEFLTGMPTRHEDISRAVARLVATAAEKRLGGEPTASAPPSRQRDVTVCHASTSHGLATANLKPTFHLDHSAGASICTV